MGTIFFSIFLIAYLFVCASIVFLVLAQEGKGGGLSGIAGSSALGESFGFGGAASALRRLTRWAAGVFLVMTMILTLWADALTGRSVRDFVSESGSSASVPAQLPADANAQAPSAPAGNAPAAGAPPSAAPAASATPAATPAPTTPQ